MVLIRFGMPFGSDCSCFKATKNYIIQLMAIISFCGILRKNLIL